MEVTLRSGELVRLGRIRPEVLASVIELEDFFNAAGLEATLPEKCDYYTNAAASMSRVYLNDQMGCCVISGKYHAAGAWSAADTTQGQQPAVVGTDAEVRDMYRRICGPGDPGCVITRVLDYWRGIGLPMSGKLTKIDGYVRVNPRNRQLVQSAIYLFGGLTLGVNLPAQWTCKNCTWDVTRSQIVGGHDVQAVGYDERGVQCSTWGGIVTITWAAFLQGPWVEECYAALAPLWYGDDRLSAVGLDVDALKAALAQLGGGVLPPIPDPAPPAPPVPPVPIPPAAACLIVPQTLPAGTYCVVPQLPPTPPFNSAAAPMPWAQWVQLLIALLQQLLGPIPIPPLPPSSSAE